MPQLLELGLKGFLAHELGGAADAWDADWLPDTDRGYTDLDQRYPGAGTCAALTGAGIPIGVAPIELKRGSDRAIGISIPPGRRSLGYFGGAVIERDVSIYLVARREADPGALVDSMLGPARRLHGYTGSLIPCLAATGFRVLACELTATSTTDDERLRPIVWRLDFEILTRGG